MSGRFSRRAAFSGAAVLVPAALAARCSAPAHAEATDAELVRLCTRWIAVEDEAAAVVEPYTRVVEFTYSPADAARMEALETETAALFDAIAETPATTNAGRRAKARVAMRTMLERGEEYGPREGGYIAEQLCRDVLAGSGWLARMDAEAADRAAVSDRLMAEHRERRSAEEAARAEEPPAAVGTPESREAMARRVARIAIDHWRERRVELRAARLLNIGGAA